MDICPFCKADPYEWVDIGVGYEAVAVTCCDEGYAYFVLGLEEHEVRNIHNSHFFLYGLQAVHDEMPAHVLTDADFIIPF